MSILLFGTRTVSHTKTKPTRSASQAPVVGCPQNSDYFFFVMNIASETHIAK